MGLLAAAIKPLLDSAALGRLLLTLSLVLSGMVNRSVLTDISCSIIEVTSPHSAVSHPYELQSVA